MHIVYLDDWCGIYIEDKLYKEGHNINSIAGGDDIYLLKLAEEKGYKSSDITKYYMSDEEQDKIKEKLFLPYYLSDLKNLLKHE